MPYQNPVLSLPRVDHGDPSILRFCGRYYLYHTGTERVPVYVSTDLVHWEPLGTALEASRRPGHWAQIDLWAPEVIYENGLFYMYVAGAQKRDGRADDEIRRIGVAVAERPEGPFRLADEPLTDEWSIDAHPFKDADGTYYLFYNVRNELTRGPGGVIGCGNVVDRMLDLRTLAGRPSLVCRPELPHEGNLEGTWFWNEGPFVLRGYGRYYQMYSGGCYYQPTYHVAFAQSPICHGADAPARGWTKEPSPFGGPVLASNARVWGPGHHVATKGPNGVHDYLVYHGRQDKASGRSVFLDRLFWHAERPFSAGPTADPQPMPARPVAAIAQESIDGLRLLGRPGTAYLFETDFVAPDGAVIYGAYLDERAYLAVRLDPEGRRAAILRREGGPASPETMLPLPADYHSDVPHRCRFIRNGRDFDLFLDEILVWRGRSTLGPGRAGLAGRMEVPAASLTPMFWDHFAGEAEKGERSGLMLYCPKADLGDWEIPDGGFAVTAGGARGTAGFNKALRAPGARDYEIEVGLAGPVSVYPWYAGEDRFLRADLSPERGACTLVHRGGAGSWSREYVFATPREGIGAHLLCRIAGQEAALCLNGGETWTATLRREDADDRVGFACAGEGRIISFLCVGLNRD